MAKLTPVVVDFESFWSVEHSLTKMNPIAYVMHPDTEIISCAIKVGNDKTECAFGEEVIREGLHKLDWSDKLLVGHNMSGFDSMILRWRFGIKPAMWGCTLAMARPHHMLDVGGSLSKLVERYELGKKDQTALLNTKGKHLKDFTPEEIRAMREYNIADTEQCAALFKILLAKTPKKEMVIIDQIIRMLVEPQFECDTELLETTLAEERWRKKEALLKIAKTWDAACTDPDDAAEEVRRVLASSHKFAAFLEERGVVVPAKISKTTGKETFALAKTDEEFLALQEHDDPIVAAAASARLGVKSTILESRIESFLEVAEATGGKLPIATNYYAAHTGRTGGSMKLNQSNLPRVGKDKAGKPKATNALRCCMKAPAGKKVIVADLSGIELRMNMFLWKVPYAMDLFQADPEKADLYRYFAAHELYQCEESEVTKDQRQVGKVAHLGLGYGAGAGAFRGVAKLMGGIDMELTEAKKIVAAYRNGHGEIVRGWDKCNSALPHILVGSEYQIDPWGLCHTAKGMIITPQGALRYPNLRKEVNQENGKEEWVYGDGRNQSKIYGGRMVENIVQHLARFVLTDAQVQYEKDTGFPVAHTVYDEIVSVVPEKDAEQALAHLQGLLRTPPPWFPQLVTWSEGDIADSYGDAK